MVHDRGVTGGGFPRCFGRYELTSLLGQGGMGTVYRATLAGPAGFRKEVALKVIKADKDASSDEVREGFVREARVCGLLRHPNVVDVYDFGVTEDQPWLAMELVDGWPLDDIVRDHPSLPATVVLDIATQIADGLVHAHELQVQGVSVALVHRDLKPANVLVTRQGGVKVMDFGLARATRGDDALTQSGVVRGTPAYMSPEQASGEDLDPRSDLFSFGVMLFELATGERPFLRPNLVALIMALVQVEDSLADPAFLAPAEARVPGLGAVIHRCMRRDPNDRFDRARDLSAIFRALVRAQPPGPSLRSWADAVLLGNGPAPSLDLGTTRGPPLSIGDTAQLTGFDGTGGVAQRTNLGAESSSFVGRAADLVALAELAGPGGLVTVVGPGGTGKTRLVRRFAREGLERWISGGGVWFCDLSGATDLTGALAALAGPLGVPLDQARGEQAAIDQVGFAVAGRGRVLVVVDNVEQVLGPVRRILERWLEFAQDALLLVTSRERLRAAGERVLELGPLSEPEAVQLFAERARGARSDFRLGSEVAGTVSRIVRRLDGIPLAVELAAARVAVLSAEQILERLDERFKLLRGRDGSGRQGTLRATIDWSWNLLDPSERAALAQCATFRGSFDLEAVEEILELDDADAWVLDAIETLRDKSLVRAEQSRELGGAMRFSLYESIRAFAQEQLGAGSAAVDGRHASYFLAWGERQLKRLDGPDGRLRRRELAAELDNLTAVFERFVDRAPEMAARAVLVMVPVLRLIGPLDGHVALLERAVAATDATEVDLTVRSRLRQARGYMRRIRSRFEDAEADFQAALRLAQEGADRALEGEILDDLGLLALDRGQVQSAEAFGDQLGALADAMGDRRLQAASVHLRGRALSYDPKRRGLANTLLADALARHEELGLVPQTARIMQSLAVARAQELDHAGASALFSAALAVHQDLGDRRGQASNTGNLGILAIQAGQFDEAQRMFARALRMHRRLGDRRAEGIFQMNGAVCRALQEDLEGARTDIESAVVLLGRHASPTYHGAGWRSLGTVQQLQGQLEHAEVSLRRAIEVFESEESGWMRASGEGALGALLADRDALIESDLLLAQAEQGVSGASGLAFVSLCRGHLELAQARAHRKAGDLAGALAFEERAASRLRWRGYDADAASAAAPQEATNALACVALGRALERTRSAPPAA